MSKVNVSLSGSLATVAGIRNIEVEASNVAEALKTLAGTFGIEFENRLFDNSGKPRRFINIYVNGRDYRFLKKLETELNPNDHVQLIPAVSGG